MGTIEPESRAEGRGRDAGARQLTPDERIRWTRIGLLAALAMALGYLESFIPLPLPGLKLGLANIAILIALAQGEVSGAFFISIVKVLAAGLLFGNPVSMAFSAAGSTLAFLAMAPLSRIRGMRLEMVSIVGALFHELGQLAVASAILGTSLVWYSAPILLVAGCITGLACGIIATRTTALLQDSGWDDAAEQGSQPPTAAAAIPTRSRPEPMIAVPAKAAIIGFIVYVVAMLHASGFAMLAVGLAVAAIACALARVSPALFARMLSPLAAILVVTFVAQIANTQHLEAAFALGSIVVSRQALTQTGTMLARLLGVSAASLALMGLVPSEELVGAARWLMRPLERLGVSTRGPALALETALQSVPLLAASLRETLANRQADSSRSGSGARSLWRETIPHLIADAYRNALSRQPGEDA